MITVFCRVYEDKKIRKNMDHNYWREGNYKQDVGENKERLKTPQIDDNEG